MAGVAKMIGLLVMAILPGGLLFLAAFVLARAVAQGVRREEGSTGRRFAKAWAQVRLRDLDGVRSFLMRLAEERAVRAREEEAEASTAARKPNGE